jgi:hypothetical protein
MLRSLAVLFAGAALLSAAAYRSDFAPELSNLGTVGSNPYFNLTPGYKQYFTEGGTHTTITVLAEIVIIDGVQCRVVEDREEKDGKPVEFTRDYYAIDKATGDVYYFGEDVDVYKDGKVSNHEGSWRSGVEGAKYGLMMPGRIVAGDRFFQERAPRQRAMDRSEVISLAEKVVTPAGTFDCVHFKDSSAIEKAVDHKWYAKDVGLVKDGKAVLMRVER